MRNDTRSILTFFLASVCAFAADSDFNGRWLIRGDNEPRIRAWWLEVKGAGTPSPNGSFVSAYGGDRNIIHNMTIKDGELRFSFERPRRDGGKLILSYRARLKGDKLEGVFEPNDSRPPMRWIGWRAPVIKDKDDGSWKEGKPIALFDGKGMDAFEPNDGWSVQDGILRNSPRARDLMTKDSFWNFRLQVEYRVAEKSNSGIGLRGRYEIQILEDYGRPPDSHGNGALYSRIVPKVNASKPAGEWQTYDIRVVGRDLTVILNGQKIIDRQQIEGLTAIASNPYEDQPGPLVLQGDHGPVEFRKIILTPLVKK